MHAKKTRLVKSLAHFLDQLDHKLFPLWLSAGIDEVTGAGFDVIGADGLGHNLKQKPVIGQALLIRALADAQLAGFGIKAETAVRKLFEFVSRSAVSVSRSNGYAHWLTETNTPCEGSLWLSDHVNFVIASMSAYKAYRHTGDLRRITNIWKWMETRFREEGDWFETDSKQQRIELPTCLAMLDATLQAPPESQQVDWLSIREQMLVMIQHRLQAKDLAGLADQACFTAIDARHINTFSALVKLAVLLHYCRGDSSVLSGATESDLSHKCLIALRNCIVQGKKIQSCVMVDAPLDLMADSIQLLLLEDTFRELPVYELMDELTAQLNCALTLTARPGGQNRVELHINNLLNITQLGILAKRRVQA